MPLPFITLGGVPPPLIFPCHDPCGFSTHVFVGGLSINLSSAYLCVDLFPAMTWKDTRGTSRERPCMYLKSSDHIHLEMENYER